MNRISKLYLHLCNNIIPKSNNEIRMIDCTPMDFNQWIVGMKLITKRRTISEYDIINFVQLTGYNQESLFQDMIYLKNTMGHDKRMAPGLLTVSIADALIVGSGIIEGYAIALLGIHNLIAKHPVYANDTIVVHVEVTKTQISKSKTDRGVVTTHQRVENQHGQVVLEYDVSRMLLIKQKKIDT